MADSRGEEPVEIGPSPLDQFLAAGVNDGLRIEGRTYPIATIGRSEGEDGFATREFTLGEDEDFYLVVEGQLASGDPGRCRAVKTHELGPGEVRCPGEGRRGGPASLALRLSDDAPDRVIYQGRAYRYFRRVDAHYVDADRQCDRVSWDYELDRRNLAIERWPGGEMAVYEGQVVPLDRIRVVRNYGPFSSSRSQGSHLPAEFGVLAGILLMTLGGIMMFF